MQSQTRRADLRSTGCCTLILVPLDTFSCRSPTEPNISQKVYFISYQPFGRWPWVQGLGLSQLHGGNAKEITVLSNLSHNQHQHTLENMFLSYLLQYQVREIKSKTKPTSQISLLNPERSFIGHQKWLFFQNIQVSWKAWQQRNTFNSEFFNNIRSNNRQKHRLWSSIFHICYPLLFKMAFRIE